MFDTYHLPQKNTSYHLASFTDIRGEDRTSPAGDTGTLRCAPRPPPRKINLRRTGATTTPPRPAKGAPKEKGQGGRADSAEFLAGVNECLEVYDGPGVVYVWVFGLFTFI